MLDEVMRFQTVRAAWQIDASIQGQAAVVDSCESPAADEGRRFTLEQELGLVQGLRTLAAGSMDDDFNDDFNDEDDDE